MKKDPKIAFLESELAAIMILNQCRASMGEDIDLICTALGLAFAYTMAAKEMPIDDEVTRNFLKMAYKHADQVLGSLAAEHGTDIKDTEIINKKDNLN